MQHHQIKFNDQMVILPSVGAIGDSKPSTLGRLNRSSADGVRVVGVVPTGAAGVEGVAMASAFLFQRRISDSFNKTAIVCLWRGLTSNLHVQV